MQEEDTQKQPEPKVETNLILANRKLSLSLHCNHYAIYLIINWYDIQIFGEKLINGRCFYIRPSFRTDMKKDLKKTVLSDRICSFFIDQRKIC